MLKYFFAFTINQNAQNRVMYSKLIIVKYSQEKCR